MKAIVPFPGSQTNFLTCPVSEILYEGTRSPGKSTALLMKFLQHVDQDFGNEWRGVIFRRTFGALSDLIAKSKQLMYSIFPTGQVKFNQSTKTWEFPGGETLQFSYMRDMKDYWVVAHGKEWTFIGWDELTTWEDLECYDATKSSLRSTYPGPIPKMYLSTANPFGVGHDAVKRRFIDPAPASTIITDELGTRVRIHGHFSENLALVEHDQAYIDTLSRIKDNVLRQAWYDGSWDLQINAMFSEFWDSKIHVLKPFVIPKKWSISRSYDWGSSAPYNVFWIAESNGEALPDGRCFPKGTIFIIQELYGAEELHSGEFVGLRETTEKTTEKILAIDGEWLKKGFKVQPGPADNSIYDVMGGDSIGTKMEKLGLYWIRSNKGPGSRVAGVQAICSLLEASKEQPMESPGLFVFNWCIHFLRTFPVLPRDQKNLDDIDTNCDDHGYDTIRYYISSTKHSAGEARVTGT